MEYKRIALPEGLHQSIKEQAQRHEMTMITFIASLLADFEAGPGWDRNPYTGEKYDWYNDEGWR